MDQPLPLSPRPKRHIKAQQADAFDTLAAWRAPEPRHPRFGPANDWLDTPVRADSEDAEPLMNWRWGEPIPPHVIAVGGAVVFAILGALFGNALHI